MYNGIRQITLPKTNKGVNRNNITMMLKLKICTAYFFDFLAPFLAVTLALAFLTPLAFLAGAAALAGLAAPATFLGRPRPLLAGDAAAAMVSEMMVES